MIYVVEGEVGAGVSEKRNMLFILHFKEINLLGYTSLMWTYVIKLEVSFVFFSLQMQVKLRSK